MRTRIVVEGVKNETTYLSHNYLAHGEVTDRQRGSFRKKRTPLPVVYAQYSDEYIPGSRLTTEQDIYEIYQRELVTIIQPYMGIWQLFQACNILKCPLTWIYPSNTNPNIRRDFNRTMYPITHTTQPGKSDNAGNAIIMWTYMNRTKGLPNHFVPILQLHHPNSAVSNMQSENALVDGILKQEAWRPDGLTSSAVTSTT